jgi:hypothetical protein
MLSYLVYIVDILCLPLLVLASRIPSNADCIDRMAYCPGCVKAEVAVLNLFKNRKINTFG